jgi:hypothetical protein
MRHTVVLNNVRAGAEEIVSVTRNDDVHCKELAETVKELIFPYDLLYTQIYRILSDVYFKSPLLLHPNNDSYKSFCQYTGK